MTASDIKFRCSSLGKIMNSRVGLTDNQTETLATLQAKEKRTEKQEKTMQELLAKQSANELPEGIKNHLADIYAAAVHYRREEVFNKYLAKGTEREEDSITLLSLQRKMMLKKNDAKFADAFIKGEPDIILADHIIDIKTSWNLNSFLRTKVNSINMDYYWQVQGYMALTGAKTAEVCYCLVNGTAKAIDDEKRRMSYQFADPYSEEYKEQCRQIEINMIFDIAAFIKENPTFNFDNDLVRWYQDRIWDIPASQRLCCFPVERNDADIAAMRERIEICREWMNENLFKN